MMHRAWMAALAGGALLLGACSQQGGEKPAAESEGTAAPAPAAKAAAASQKFVATLTGANEVPAVKTSASGTATFTQTSDSTLDFTIMLDSIENVTMAHLHKGAAGQDGPPVVPLFQGAFSGSGTLVSGTIKASDLKGTTMTALLAAIRADSIYVNVHTKAHPSGELRGQVMAP